MIKNVYKSTKQTYTVTSLLYPQIYSDVSEMSDFMLVSLISHIVIQI